MEKRHRACTCADLPGVVDITKGFIWSQQQQRKQSQSGEEEVISPPKAVREGRQELLKNLQRTGWSPVQVDVTKIMCDDPPINNMELLQKHRQWKDLFVELFEPEVVNNFKKEQDKEKGVDSALQYMEAESGAAGTASSEPKQSWQVHRCTCPSVCSSPRNNHDSLHSTSVSSSCEKLKPTVTTGALNGYLQGWANLAHAVVVTVRTLLEFPPNVLVQEKPCCLGNNSIHSEVGRCSVDLLRAFYYDTVSEGEEKLGSSPHTDWGSFTVVWQDDVGGLETFCHACGSWTRVPTAFSNNGDSVHEDSDGVLQFILHVGDVTSLAAGRALQQEREHQYYRQKRNPAMARPLRCIGSKNAESTSATALVTTNKVMWPSPCHRVVSPTGKEKRASLVYFCYPPPEISMDQITAGFLQSERKNLDNYWLSSSLLSLGQGCCQNQVLQEKDAFVVPYEDYYLLKNQQSTTKRKISSEQQFQAIATRPLKDVFKEKWLQVQRSS